MGRGLEGSLTVSGNNPVVTSSSRRIRKTVSISRGLVKGYFKVVGLEVETQSKGPLTGLYQGFISLSYFESILDGRGEISLYKINNMTIMIDVHINFLNLTLYFRNQYDNNLSKVFRFTRFPVTLIKR